MNISFPVGCDNYGKKIAFLERTEEKLRLVHNGMGRWYKEGLTLVQYNKFPNKIKNRYPYKAQLTEVEFRNFQRVVFEKMSNVIHFFKNQELQNAKDDNVTWSPDLDNDIEE